MFGSEMIGFWDSDCPVKSGKDDLPVTVYRKPGQTRSYGRLLALHPVHAKATKAKRNTLATSWIIADPFSSGS